MLQSPNPHHVPALDRDTIEFALRLAPNRCPDPKDSEREVWMKAGAHRLAAHLEAILKQQETNVLDT